MSSWKENIMQWNLHITNLYNKVLSISNYFDYPSNSNTFEKNLHVMRAKGLAKFVCNNEVLLYQGSFSYMYCYYWGNQNSLLYQGLHYIEVHYIKVPLYNETSLCEQILPVPWLFVISRIHCICLKGHQNNYFSRRTRAS